ncbi:MAG: hypothetical protein AB4038_09710 [Prochloraceae cyanobacterium]
MVVFFEIALALAPKRIHADINRGIADPVRAIEKRRSPTLTGSTLTKFK